MRWSAAGLRPYLHHPQERLHQVAAHNCSGAVVSGGAVVVHAEGDGGDADARRLTCARHGPAVYDVQPAVLAAVDAADYQVWGSQGRSAHCTWTPLTTRSGDPMLKAQYAVDECR